MDLTLRQQELYPETRMFDQVTSPDETLNYLECTLYLREEHCLGHFAHYPILPLSEVGSLAARTAALHCQALASKHLEFWSKAPIAVVAKYVPGALVYGEPAEAKGITLKTVSYISKFSTRLIKAHVQLVGVDKTDDIQVKQDFNFSMVFRTDLGWSTQAA